MATALLNGINDFNGRTRQGQASAERQFDEGRLAMAGDDLRIAEDRLARFLQTNRDIRSSPELMLQQERIQRDLGLRQQVFTSLTQAYEDAGMREARDIPVITVVEPPSVPALPEPRKRLVSLLLGLLLGGFVGVFLVFASEAMSRYGSNENAEANEFVRALHEMTGEWRRLAFWRR
jgi:LPS O-antigen subunit length determinant protein (WzzB/FepE family)